MVKMIIIDCRARHATTSVLHLFTKDTIFRCYDNDEEDEMPRDEARRRYTLFSLV